MWEAQCTLLLWLAILVLLPFDMASLDSSLGAGAAPCARTLNPEPGSKALDPAPCSVASRWARTTQRGSCPVAQALCPRS